MRIKRLSKSGLLTAALALATATLDQAETQAQSVEPAKPAPPVISTNARPATARPDGLKRLERDLFKPLQPFSSESALESMTAPPVQLPTQQQVPESKRLKEMIERRKNWVFMNPDEFLSGPTPSEILGVKEYDRDGKTKEKLSPLEQFYQRQERSHNPAGPAGGDKTDPRDRSDSDPTSADDEDRPEGGVEKSFGNLFASDLAKTNGPAIARHSTLSDILGLNQTAESPERTLAHKARMEDYRQMLGLPAGNFGTAPPSPLTGPGQYNPFYNGNSSIRDSLNPANLPSVAGQASATSSRPFGFDAVQATINPVLTPTATPDAWARVLSPASVSPTVPKTDIPKPTPPGSTFSVPRRAF